MSDVKITASRLEQSKRDKESVLDRLKNKKPRTKTLTVEVGGDELELTFQAISSHDLDALQTKHAPTLEQKAKGFNFNPDTFGPALVAACSSEPEMTEEDTKELWESGAWSTGELGQLFDTCISLCMEGMNTNFTNNA